MAKNKVSKSNDVLVDLPTTMGTYFDKKKGSQEIEGKYIGEGKEKTYESKKNKNDNSKYFGKPFKAVYSVHLDNGDVIKFDENHKPVIALFDSCKVGARVRIHYRGLEHTKRKGDFFKGDDKKQYNKWAGKVGEGKSKGFMRFTKLQVLKG